MSTADSIREPDALLQSWRRTVARRRHDAAIYDTRREVLRTFEAIETEAAGFGDAELAPLAPGAVVGIQLGNHPSWPALLLACIRRGLVAVPLERSISEQERASALQTCRAAASVTAAANDKIAVTSRAAERTGRIEWDNGAPSLLKLTSGTTAAPRAIRFRSEQLLADCEQIC
ncbi:MAG: AMP-binding protein, partial [Chthoniobacterales bacterium]|nr:AMP-binding protein [Chthoniobacterales bacterium]